MKISLFGFFLLLSFPAIAGVLTLSQSDALGLINETVFPLIKNELVAEGGKEYNLESRGLQSVDSLLEFSCSQKYFGGMQVDVACSANISADARVHDGNRLQKGIAGSVRATIGWPDDVSKFGEAFQHASVCRPDVVTQLYTSDEHKDIVLPTGKKIRAPLLTVGCYGDGQHHQVSQLIVTIFPR